ncbi:MAG: hypothetical protein Q8R47_05110 [Nanoarchaeota archaeon]|nr:hypothetical protein [Nanoarchaeota archaeon]
MKKIVLLIVLFLLSFSLVAAVDISTSKTDYSGGETVTVTITDCAGTSIVEFHNPGGNVVDIKSGEGSWSTSYNTLSDSADGKYMIEATCTNGAAPPKNFCVDAPGCVSSVPPPPDSPSVPVSSQAGGSACNPNWSCDAWSFCGPNLMQTHSCIDLNNCQAAKEESRPCEACLESWVCSVWNECSAGAQTRACYDEHFCETTNLKPALQKGCNAADPVPPPVRISTQLPPPYVPQAPAVVQQSFFSKAWDNYKYYILGGAAAIALAVLVLLALHIFMPKKVAYNLNELKQWVRKEKQMGTADPDIREILKQNTGWTDQEIDMAFESSQQPSRTIKNTSA